jgi:hypothetical protein
MGSSLVNEMNHVVRESFIPLVNRNTDMHFSANQTTHPGLHPPHIYIYIYNHYIGPGGILMIREGLMFFCWKFLLKFVIISCGADS